MTRQGKARASTYENLIEFWEGEAADLGETPEATIRDHYFRIHELHVLVGLLPMSDRLLDVGCGTGFGTMLLSRRSRYTLGVDFSKRMIEWAERLRDEPPYRRGIMAAYSPLFGWSDDRDASVEFSQGDVLDLALDGDPFDVIAGQRILINLPSHEDQMRALRGLRAYATSGAWLFLTEVTRQGHERTDDYRARFGLPPLEKYWHNNYIDESRYDDWTDAGWRVTTGVGFQTYTLLSKVVYPAACGLEQAQFVSPANAAAMEVACLLRSSEAVGEVGVASLLDLYVEKVRSYDPALAGQVAAWISAHGDELAGWEGLGHQRMIIARAVD